MPILGAILSRRDETLVAIATLWKPLSRRDNTYRSGMTKVSCLRHSLNHLILIFYQCSVPTGPTATGQVIRQCLKMLVKAEPKIPWLAHGNYSSSNFKCATKPSPAQDSTSPA